MLRNRRFVVRDMGLSIAAAKEIGKILQSSPAFSCLDVSSNILGNKGAVLLVK